MKASHRNPAVLLMTAGGILGVIGFALPRVVSPDTPPGVIVASTIILWVATPLFISGACIFARGIGYPWWLGLFSFTLLGLLILMLLPDRYPDAEDLER
jgi:hypothetical protein